MYTSLLCTTSLAVIFQFRWISFGLQDPRKLVYVASTILYYLCPHDIQCHLVVTRHHLTKVIDIFGIDVVSSVSCETFLRPYRCKNRNWNELQVEDWIVYKIQTHHSFKHTASICTLSLHQFHVNSLTRIAGSERFKLKTPLKAKNGVIKIWRK